MHVLVERYLKLGKWVERWLPAKGTKDGTLIAVGAGIDSVTGLPVVNTSIGGAVSVGSNTDRLTANKIYPESDVSGVLVKTPVLELDAGTGNEILGFRCVTNPVDENEAASALSLGSDKVLFLSFDKVKEVFSDDSIEAIYVVGVGSALNTAGNVIDIAIPATTADKTTAFNNTKTAMRKLLFAAGDGITHARIESTVRHNTNRESALIIGGVPS